MKTCFLIYSAKCIDPIELFKDVIDLPYNESLKLEMFYIDIHFNDDATEDETGYDMSDIEMNHSDNSLDDVKCCTWNRICNFKCFQ